MTARATEDDAVRGDEGVRLGDALVVAVLFVGIFAIGAEVVSALGVRPEWLRGRTYTKGLVGGGIALAYWAWDALRRGRFLW
jgi:protein-S-isoprenylcysteine O-methyltransferase Ste14